MKYDFTVIEKKWHKIWEEKQLYKSIMEGRLSLNQGMLFENMVAQMPAASFSSPA